MIVKLLSNLILKIKDINFEVLALSHMLFLFIPPYCFKNLRFSTVFILIGYYKAWNNI